MIRSRSDLGRTRRMVVKVGSSLLTDANDGLRMPVVERIATEIAALQQHGTEVCLVTSGAVALGRVQMRWLDKHLSVHEKQAAAAIGQPLLMHAYKQAFAAHGLQVAQLLLTKDDLRHRRRYLNASNTSQTLFAAGVVPVVNENDTVVVEEIKFGDNDTLGALVSLLIDAELMVMMTDVDGLFSENPAVSAAAERLSTIESLTAEIMAMADDAGSAFGTGGMVSKLKAARIATRGGVAAAIVNGHSENILAELMQGNDVGSLFLCGADRQSRRQHWIADVLHPAGKIHVDEGAARAIVKGGGSLLPIGMTGVEGLFDKGECVEICAPDGVIARGLCNYNADEMRRLIGISSEKIEEVLGFVDFTSVIHRDNLVLSDLKQASLKRTGTSGEKYE
ncbi:MAG: glutamate 5-kinase [Mariprofundaceae bacterium]|nr:glutamate 5-kinase [Mariprofundaceae bacterium]